MVSALLGAALTAASTLYAGHQSRKAAEQYRTNIKSQMAENQSWYDRAYNEDATQRADAQRILSLTNETIRNRNKAAAGAAAVGGGTEESVAATKAANAKAMADATSQIAASAEARKDSIESQYLSGKSALQEQLNNYEQNRANNIAAAGAAGIQTGANLMGSDSDLVGWLAGSQKTK